MNILITGACGVTSRSVVRSLLLSKKFKSETFIGIDICQNKYGLYEELYNKICCVPKYSSPDYRQAIKKIIKKEKIDVAIVIPELEVLYWAKNPFNVKCLLPPPKFSELVISKKRLYETLEITNLVPKFIINNSKNLLTKKVKIPFSYPVWIRDFQVGSTSGKGSFLAKNINQLTAWVTINDEMSNFMISQYLPGRNYACLMLYYQGRLQKIGVIERLKYFMGKVSMSGITGNISEGKLMNNSQVEEVSTKAINLICKKTKELMNGIVTVDLKENVEGVPCITEINIRHIATTSSFALAGLNFAEYQLLYALNLINEVLPGTYCRFNRNNLILRDIDGSPIYVNSSHIKCETYKDRNKSTMVV